MKILLAEDEADMSRVVSAALKRQGYTVVTVDNGIDAVKATQEQSFNILLMDIMMPKLDGLSALKQIREQGNDTYAIMLTAKTQIDDKVNGFQTGADDYVTKPFSLRELIMRIKSRERRINDFNSHSLTYKDLVLNIDDQNLHSENDISLSNHETKTLQYLMKNNGKSIDKQLLVDNLNDSAENLQSIEFIISYLQQKIKAIGSYVQIKNKKDSCMLK